MTKDNTTQLTDSLASLKRASIGEIRDWLSKYPYCLNLHYLLLEKELHETPEADLARVLATVSTYATNREHLFQKVKLFKQPQTQTSPQLQSIPLSEETSFEEDPDLIEDEFSEELLEDLTHPSYLEESVSDTTDLDRPFAGPNQLMPEEDSDNGQSILEKILESSALPSEEEGTEPYTNELQPPVPSFKLEARTLAFLTAYSKVLREKTIILDPKPKSKTAPEEEDSLSEKETIVGKPVAKTLKKSTTSQKSETSFPRNYGGGRCSARSNRAE